MNMYGTRLSYTWLKTFILILSASHVLSCWGWYSYPDPPTTTARKTTKVKGSHRDEEGKPVIPTYPSDYNGWTPSPELMKKWQLWVDDYHNKTLAYDERDSDEIRNAIEKLKKEGGGWPLNWQDLAAPERGDDAPPWSYVPQHIGKPSFCFLWPVKGNCTEKITRWAYNAFENKCFQFEYSGCGGNQNNYKKQLTCEQACMTAPVSGCDPDTDIPVPNYDTHLLDIHHRARDDKTERLFSDYIEEISASNSQGDII